MIPEPLTTINVTLWHCDLYVTVTSADPNTGIGSPEYKQSLTCEGERFLSSHNSLNVLSEIRDGEAPVSNCISTVLPPMSTDTFQGVAFPGDVMFNSWYSSIASSSTLLTGLCGFSVGLLCLLLHTYFLQMTHFTTFVANCLFVLA